jgi:SAM-dependent methyltransferase
MQEWVDANRRLWDASVAHHVSSAFYDVAAFKAGRSSLDRLELDAAGPVEGRSLLHLQCHFGMTTLSWARLGAEATGVDFSAEAIRAARALSGDIGVPATFVEGDVMTVDLGRTFDVVFASWGAISWIPDIGAWMRTAARHLRPGGRLALVDHHPFLWPWDDDPGVTGFVPRYRYFQDGEPERFEVEETYAGAPVAGQVEYGFNHDLGAVVTAAVGAGLAIERLTEHPVIPWPALPFLVRDAEEGWWRSPSTPLPLSFSLVATRRPG